MCIVYNGMVSLLLIENKMLQQQLVNNKEELYQTRERAESILLVIGIVLQIYCMGYYRFEEDVFRNDTGTGEIEERRK